MKFRNLGSFYADIFVSCTRADRAGSAAHYPTVVIEVFSQHIGEEFTDKRRAYLASAQLRDYLIIDSRKQCINRFSWGDSIQDGRRLVACEYSRTCCSAITIVVTNVRTNYAGTNIPSIADRISSDEQEVDFVTD